MAMSGGIDSSVSAILLHEMGYEVVGMTMKTWDYASSGSSKKETGCCSLDSINDARQIAVEKGFPHYIIDIREEFGNHVINPGVDDMFYIYLNQLLSSLVIFRVVVVAISGLSCSILIGARIVVQDSVLEGDIVGLIMLLLPDKGGGLL